MKKTFLISILTLLFMCLTSMASAQWVTTQLTTNSEEDRAPQINNSGQVVWSSGEYPNTDILYYDGNTVTQLTNNSSSWESSPEINDSGHVVWIGHGINYYDGSIITSLPNNSLQVYSPKINDNGHVVWEGRGGSNGSDDYEIFYYDGNTVTQLTNNSYKDSDQQINDSGHVVWRGWGSSGVFYYDGSTTTLLLEGRKPKINNSGQVVWTDYDDKIFYYDGTTVTQLTNNTRYNEYYPQINNSGHVVWYGSGGSDNGVDDEIFYYDGATVTQLTTNSRNDRSPNINDSGQVIWRGYDETGYKIFYYDGNTVTQLTNNYSSWESPPKINNNGQVVWDGQGGSDGGTDDEIFIAELVEDADSDGSGYLVDNCPYTFNSGQEDIDFDGLGDVCDVCPALYNPVQEDSDKDGIGDVCGDACPDDPLNDADEDGICHSVDNCPGISNPGQEDDDDDGIGDVCDAVTSYAECRIEWGDSSSVPTLETSRTEQATHEAFFAIYPNNSEIPDCYNNPNDGGDPYPCGPGFLCEISENVDGLGGSYSVFWEVCIEGGYGSGPFIGEYFYGTWDVVCESDGDGINALEDNCPGFCNVEQLDADEDSIGDVCDDNPGCGGCGQDACELSCDIDADGDGIVNALDNCPVDANPDQLDTDSDTIGNVCDTCTNNDITAPEIVYGPVRITTDGQIYPEDIYGCTYDCSFSRDTAADGFTPVRTGYVPLSLRINDDMLETASEYVPEVSYIFTECDEDGTALPGALPIVKYGPTSLSSDSNGDFTSYVYRLEDDIDGDGESNLSKYYQLKFTVTDCVGQTSEAPANGGVYYIQLVPELP